MTELSGTLAGVGLPAIVRFLGGLKKRGCLRITQHGWQGEVFFDDGQVTDARLGSRTGLAVLDALVEVLPGGSFVFESQTVHAGEPSIRLGGDALQTHLDKVSERLANGAGKLPQPDAVPVLAVHHAPEVGGEEPLPLDRGALQTLLAIDGHRDVREVVAQRGSFDALWQLGTLIEVGLVQVGSPVAPGVTTEVIRPPEAGVILERRPAPPTPLQPQAPLPPKPPVVEPHLVPDRSELNEDADPVREPGPGQCPKLGFDDDAGHSFDRPTRLHRCFAAGTPLPLSLDQQRELCLSDQFGTCPRLSTLTSPIRFDAKPVPEPDEPRIVRLPFASRFATAARESTNAPAAEPRRLRASGAVPQEQSAERPRPLRARLDRTNAPATIDRSAATAPPNAHATATPRSGIQRSMPASAAARDDTPAASAVTERPTVVDADQTPPHLRARASAQAQPDAITQRRLRRLRVGVIAGGAVVLLVLAALAYALVPQTATLFSDESIDPSALPNTSRVAAGTPVSALTAPRATPAAISNRATAAAAQPTALAAAAEPTPAPVATQAAAQPTEAPAAAPRMLLDEHFATNAAKWPAGPQGLTALVNGTYRIAPQQAGQFVAVSAPITNLPADVVVSATFRKLAGPSGGGYGIIVRDQSTTPRDGTKQDGQFYVLELGDKGEVGIWRRDSDHWVDLLAWQRTDAAKPGTATNELSVRAVGNTLSMLVNGTPVTTKTDSTFASGGVGVFVGGDGNQVAVEHFSIQTP